MKKLFKFVSLLAIVWNTFAFGQTDKQSVPPIDNTQIQLATLMAQTTDNLSVIYNAGMPYETFRSKVLGRPGSAVTTEGEAILSKAYNYLKAGTTRNEIIRTDSGIEMRLAFLKLNTLGLTNEYALFSLAADAPKMDINFQVHQTESKGSSSSGCKWYQIACWIDDIFGSGTAKALITALIALLV